MAEVIPIRRQPAAAVGESTLFEPTARIAGLINGGEHLEPGKSTDPYGTVLPWTLERVQEVAGRRSDEAVVIADEVAAVDRHRRAFAEYQRSGTWGWRAQHLTRLVDTIHFAPSHASRGLQAADLVSYAHVQHRKTFKDTRAQAAWDRIWAAIQAKVWEVSIWPA